MGNALKKLSMNEFKRSYELKEELGNGSFATVKKCVHKSSGKEYAAKIIKKSTLNEEEIETVHAEASIMREIEHPHVVHLFDMFESKGKVYMVLELLTGGELFDRIVQKQSFNEKEASSLLYSLVEAIDYLHSKNVVHRDLKPENIIYATRDDDAPVKITDFGLASLRPNPETKMTTACGTPGYVAPEVLKGKDYGKEVDIWSLGVILFILLCGYPPFYHQNTEELYKNIKKGKYSFNEKYWGHISADAKHLVKRMLTVEPRERITCHQILEHPWMKSATTEDFGDSWKMQLRLTSARSQMRKCVRQIIAINRFAIAVQQLVQEKRNNGET